MKTKIIFFILLIGFLLGSCSNPNNTSKNLYRGKSSGVFKISETPDSTWSVINGEYSFNNKEQTFKFDEIKYLGTDTLEADTVKVTFFLKRTGNYEIKSVPLFSRKEDVSTMEEDIPMIKHGYIIGEGSITGGKLYPMDAFNLDIIYMKVDYEKNGNHTINEYELEMKSNQL